VRARAHGSRSARPRRWPPLTRGRTLRRDATHPVPLAVRSGGTHPSYIYRLLTEFYNPLDIHFGPQAAL